MMIAILIMIVLFAAALLGVYRMAFHVPAKEHAERPHEIPDAEQYQAERERMEKLKNG